MGVNPHDLRALQIWQTDVTHPPEFGCLKYVHVSTDTFSSAVRASVTTGKGVGRHTITHWRSAFAALGIPHTIKVENGPAYVSQNNRQFLQLWGVLYHTGIPHSATGRAIMERAYGTLKHINRRRNVW